jgi:peroxisomal 3,2-trans-enoyl-CoA isomerase
MSDTKMQDNVQLEYRGRIAIITLSNPKKLNAVTKDSFYRLACYLKEINTHNEVTVTVLTGTGRFFSA